MYFEPHRIAFIHIPKTGGSSIELFFTGYDWITSNVDEYAIYQAEHVCRIGRYRGTLCAKNRFYFQNRVREKHATQKELAAQLGPATWKDCFRFTIVRNPWERVLSVYDHAVRDAPSRMRKTFAAWLSQQEPLDHMGQRVFREWVSDWNEMNFVGRFERLEQDFAQLLAILGLPHAKLPLERHGRTGQHDPAAYNETARRIVARRCSAEIERFDFRFEEAFRPRP